MPTLLSCVIALALAQQPELLDRTVALVGGQAITLSDVRAAMALGLVDDGKGSVSEVTARLVDRELILREVQRYAPAPPEASAVEARLEQIRRHVAAPLGPVLDAFGFTDARLRAWVRDDLRTQAYLVQRFASATLPGDAEVFAGYVRQRAEFDRDGLTFEQAAPIVRERLVDARRRELVVDWLSDLRRRTDVVIVQP
jgi:hypothetical protein